MFPKKKNYEIKPPFELAKEIKSKVFSPDPLKKYSSFSGFKKEYTYESKKISVSYTFFTRNS